MSVGRKILEHLQKDQKRMTWNLGIRACSDPVDTMNHVYKCLKKIDMEWKILSMFHIIVRMKPTPTNPDPAKVALQMFALRGPITGHLLDLKAVTEDEEGY